MKIAVYASGELRTFLNSDRMLPYFVDFLKHLGHEVKVFGHTWDHCDNKNRLKHPCIDNFVIEDQKIIQNWQLEDIMIRKSMSDEIRNNPVSLVSKNNFDKFVKKYTKGYGENFGQLWSQIKCFEHFYPRVENFDMHIRWRWDNEFSEDGFGTYKSGILESVLENLYHEDTESIYVINECRLRARFSGAIKFDGHLSDELLFINKYAMEKIMVEPLEKTLHKIMKNKTHMEDTSNGHTLWYEYLAISSPNIIYQLKIPPIFKLVR